MVDYPYIFHGWSLLAYLYLSCLAYKTSVSSFIRLRLVFPSTFVHYLELTLGPAPCNHLQVLTVQWIYSLFFHQTECLAIAYRLWDLWPCHIDLGSFDCLSSLLCIFFSSPLPTSCCSSIISNSNPKSSPLLLNFSSESWQVVIWGVLMGK